MRILKTLSILLAVLILLGIGVNYWASQKILNKIASLAMVSCGDLSVNVFTKKLTIKHFELEKKFPSKSDSTRSRKLHIQMPQLQINGCAYLNFLLKDELCLQSIELKSPQIKVQEQALSQHDSTKTDTSQNAQGQFLQLLKVENIAINNGHFEGLKEKTTWLEVDTFFTTVSNFRMNFKPDSSSIDWENITGEFRQFKLNQATDKNQVLIAQSTINTEDKNMLIQDLKWKPKQGKEAFMKDLKYRKARLDLEVPQLSFVDFSLKKLLLEQILEAQKIEIIEGNLQIYSDKNIPACEDCYKPYFHEQFQDSPIEIDIDSILVKNSTLAIEVIEKNKDQAGQLKFDALYASIYQLKHQDNKRTDVDIHSKFMDEATVKIHFGFWLNSPNGAYDFNAEVDHFSLEKINPFLAYAANARIQEGEVNELNFKGTGHQHSASGEMQFNYNNLKIALFNKEKKRRKLLSKIVNGLLIQKENPDEKKFHEGKMYFERITHKSFISNWWKTVQSGFQSTMFPNLFLREELKKN